MSHMAASANGVENGGKAGSIASMLQVIACCSVLQCVAVWCAVCCSVVQCGAVC